jgi:xanthine/CO dehydrogenase XdhC/CoxF family maturation factor
MAREILDVLAELRAQKVPYAVATVVETTGSASAKTGSKAVVDGDHLPGGTGPWRPHPGGDRTVHHQ